MGTDTEFGSWVAYGDRHAILDDRTLDPVDRTMRPSDSRGRLRHPDTGTDIELRQPGSWPGGPDPAPVGRSRPAGRPVMGTDTMSDMTIRNVQRETFNSQLLTG